MPTLAGVADGAGVAVVTRYAVERLGAQVSSWQLGLPRDVDARGDLARDEKGIGGATSVRLGATAKARERDGRQGSADSNRLADRHTAMIVKRRSLSSPLGTTACLAVPRRRAFIAGGPSTAQPRPAMLRQ